MIFVENVIPDLYQWQQQEDHIALLTLINIDGSSPRPVGSQIGVNISQQKFVGTMTSGCAELALVAEAMSCYQQQENRINRYGAGSKFFDIKLPCGAGIDVHFATQDLQPTIAHLFEAHQNRSAAQLFIDPATYSLRVSSPSQHDYIKTYFPDFQVFAFGTGVNLTSFCEIAKTAGFDVIAYSSDRDTLKYLETQEIKARPLKIADDKSIEGIDKYSAVVTLFHEHDREIPILRQALMSQVSYIGALGSQKTHAQRMAQLQDLPTPRYPLDQIKGPIGLDIQARNPKEIAVSIIAELINHKQSLYKDV